MRKLLLGLVKNIFLQIVSLSIIVGMIAFAAIAWPSTPAGQTSGGNFMTYFNNLRSGDDCPPGEAVVGFDDDFKKVCREIGMTLSVVDGECSTTIGLCTMGTVSSDNNATCGTRTWSCDGQNGGTNASCSKTLGACTTPVDGVCSTTAGVCTVGTASGDNSATCGTRIWTCDGLDGGNSVDCTKTLSACITPVSGQCGTSNGSNLIAKPTSGLCTKGTATVVTGLGPWLWSCNGTGGGSNINCSANKKENGVCGSADDDNLTAKPTTNLCTVALDTTPTVTGTGPWTWTCAGKNGGSNASCNANKKQNGACGTSDDKILTAKPTANLCTVALDTTPTVTGTGPWTWTCAGINGGTPASCNAKASKTLYVYTRDDFRSEPSKACISKYGDGWSATNRVAPETDGIVRTYYCRHNGGSCSISLSYGTFTSGLSGLGDGETTTSGYCKKSGLVAQCFTPVSKPSRGEYHISKVTCVK